MYLYFVLAILGFCGSVWTQSSAAITFSQDNGAYLLGDSTTGPTIAVSGNEWPGVQRAVNDLAVDFGRVTGANGTMMMVNGSMTMQSSGPMIIAGTIGKSDLISSLVYKLASSRYRTRRASGKPITLNWSQIPMSGVSEALIIAGADKRGTIYGIYDISAQIGSLALVLLGRCACYATAQHIYFQWHQEADISGCEISRLSFMNDEQPASVQLGKHKLLPLRRWRRRLQSPLLLHCIRVDTQVERQLYVANDVGVYVLHR